MKPSRRPKEIEELFRKHDASSHIPREVTHWFYFRSFDGMDECKRNLLQLGFELSSESYDEELSRKRPYSLIMSKIHDAKSETLLKMHDELSQLAQECDGHYDGWETAIILSEDG